MCSLTCTSTGTSSAAACSSATRSSGAQAEARTTEPRRQGGQEDEADAGCPHEEGAERGASLACLPACPVPTHGTAPSSPQVPLAQKKKTEQRLAAEAARGAEVKAWVKATLVCFVVPWLVQVLLFLMRVYVLYAIYTGINT